MDPTAFAIVKNEVRRLPFVDDKIQAIVYAQGNLYAEQVGDLLMYDVANYDDDKMRVLQAAAPKMLPASCLGIITILRAFRSDKKKVQAVQLLSRQITDPMNFHVWNEVFPYQQERDTIRGIMTRQASAGVPPSPPNNHVQYAGNPYPYGLPRPKVDPNDPVYRAVDKTVDIVAGGIASAANLIAPRPAARGVVISRPGAVVYQTTTVSSYPNVSVSNPSPGVQVIQTGPPPPPGAVQYTVVNTPSPYPQQQYYRK